MVLSVTTAAAQQKTAPVTKPATSTLATDPIRCWWKTDKTAVQVGERFTLALTCSVIETSRVTVVPDLTQLEAGVVQLAPFEVLSGVRHQDVKAGMWRYLQYEYTLRLIEDNFFRLDVDIPSLSINYNVQMMEGVIAQQGRELKYVLRPLPIRINSLVPKDTADIRDASHETFADIEARSFRATSEVVAAMICFGFALVLVGLAIVKSFARVRARVPEANRGLTNAAIVRGCSRELRRLQQEVVQGGWTPDAVSRALAVVRIAGAIALSKPVAQTLVKQDEVERGGQLVMRKGLWRSQRVLVCASVTAMLISQRLAGRNSKPLEARTRALLEGLHGALEVYNAACYGHEVQLERAALELALHQGADALRQLHRFTLWPRWASSESLRPATPLEDMAWSR